MHHRALVLLCFVSCASSAQQPRVPFEFDAGIGAQPARTQQKLSQLDAKLPATFRLPMDFDELASAPDGVTTPTTRIWLTNQLKAAYLRAASSGPGAMVWPQSTRCAQHLAFMLPATTLLVSGAPGSCTSSETTVRSALAQSAIDACVDVDLPERYVMGSVVPTGLSQSQLNSYVDQRTQNLESQIALAGAGLSAFPVPDGFLPTDWVPTMRSVLWKLREGPNATRLSNARTGYTTVLNTLTTNAACFDATKSAALQMQVQQLDAELAALQLQVSTVIADGTARAAQQATCLATRSRTRPALPIPSLTDEEREFVAFWLGGVYWRMRGGGLLPLGSTQNARTYFARRPLREIANLANGTITGTRAADSLYCALFDGWGEWMDMGTTAGGQDMYEDLVQMTDRGRQQVADWTISATGAALTNGLSNSKSAEQYVREAGYSTTALYAGGLSMGPCYLYALNPMKNFVYDVPGTAQAPYGPFIDAFTAQGEFCFGAALGVGLTRSFLEGTPTNQPPVNFCNSRQCGVDSCGVSCGTCAGSSTCNSSGMCVAQMIDAGVDAGLEDAGTDAGIDAGVEVDAGTNEDAGTSPDEDAGFDQPDASMPMMPTMMADAGEMANPPAPAGCGCDASPFAFTMLALALVRRRRSSESPRGAW